MEFTALSGLKAIFPNSVNENDLADIVRFEKDYVSDTALATTTALSERTCGRAKRKCRLVGLLFTPDTAVTAAATNFFTLVVRKRTAALPGTQVAISSFAADTTTTDDIAAFAAKDLLVAAYKNAAADTDLNFAAGDHLTVEVTKAGSGMTFPSGVVTAIFEPRD